MPPEGLKMVEALAPKLTGFLPSGPTEIHVGTGLRQWRVAQALGFSLEQKNIYFSDFWGGAATVAGSKEVILLGHGLQVPRKQYLSVKHLQPFYRQIIASLPDNSLICSGRPVLVRLGMQEEDCSSGALYALHIQDDGQIVIELLIAGVCLMEKK